MKKINFIKSRKEAQWSFQLTDGRLIEILSKEGKMVINYGTRFNLETGEIYDEKNAPEGDVSLNDLKTAKMGTTVYCYDEGEVNFGFIRSMSAQRVASIVNKFKKQGFNVTPQAILHNWDAWLRDMKSGYRDEQNGYHLFSPCGCNPFSLRASSLEDCCKDWQTTYKR